MRISSVPTLESLSMKGKTVLVRVDLNVPMQGGKVADATRITRMIPTIEELIKKQARVVLLSHFDRPKGKFVPSMSLAPLVDALSEAMDGREIKFGVDCVGAAARDAVKQLKDGDVLLLENVRFHEEEEKGDMNFARELASLGDCFVNDAFSASHRSHASVTGLTQLLPSAAGRLMEEELRILDALLAAPQTPMAAIVGGSKVSTKLALLENLIAKTQTLMIGGAMANTFLLAQGKNVGKSLVEKDAKSTATAIMRAAEKQGCTLLLPIDVVVTNALEPHADSIVCSVDDIPPEGMVVEVGPQTIGSWAAELMKCKTLVWNGPVGAFEVSPFDVSTINLARIVASLTREKKLASIAGGGDTVAALTHAGLANAFTYLSTAGGAFLEFLEGKTLPGVEALTKAAQPVQKLKESV